MKKYLTLAIPSLTGLAIFSLSARLIAAVYPQIFWLKDIYWLVHFIVPLVLMGGALTLHLTAKGRRPMYLLSYLLNTIGSGWLVGAIYGLRDYIPTPELLVGLSPALLLCITSCLILLLPSEFWKEIVSLVLLVLAIGLTISGIFAWKFCSMPLGCTFIFSGLFVLPLPRAVFHADEEWTNRFRCLSSSGFGAFVLVASAAAFILSDGDILDGLDGFDFSDIGGSGKKKGK